jgi:hypothetical protein
VDKSGHPADKKRTRTGQKPDKLAKCVRPVKSPSRRAGSPNPDKSGQIRTDFTNLKTVSFNPMAQSFSKPGLGGISEAYDPRPARLHCPILVVHDPGRHTPTATSLSESATINKPWYPAFSVLTVPAGCRYTDPEDSARHPLRHPRSWPQ